MKLTAKGKELKEGGGEDEGVEGRGKNKQESKKRRKDLFLISLPLSSHSYVVLSSFVIFQRQKMAILSMYEELAGSMNDEDRAIRRILLRG